MSIPDFERAEYSEPNVIEGEVVGRPVTSHAGAAFPLALVYGAVAAALGCAAYAVIGFSGFMVSIVAIGVGWVIAKAMMTASAGLGGRPYQIAAAVMTYFAVTIANLLDILHYNAIPLGALFKLPVAMLLREILAGPFFALRNPISGAIGLLILFIGVRTAWRLAAGSPGFGGPGRTRSTDPFGLR